MERHHLTDENAEVLVEEASGRSKSEIEVLVARLAPRPDAAERLERVAEQMSLVPEPALAAARSLGPECPEPPRPIHRQAKLAPLAPERFALQVTIGEATQRKLLRAQALLRHKVPSADLAEVLDHALDALLERVEGRKFGKTHAPRATKRCSGERYVPREVRRQVVARDGMQCSFVAEDGRRCEETGFLELDHAVPVSQGGSAVAATRGPGTVEERLRAALGALNAIYAARGLGTRCEEPRRSYANGEGRFAVGLDHQAVQSAALPGR